MAQPVRDQVADRADLEAVALRELHEEVGLALGPEAVLGLLDVNTAVLNPKLDLFHACTRGV